jgi:hypothetical protein
MPLVGVQPLRRRRDWGNIKHFDPELGPQCVSKRIGPSPRLHAPRANHPPTHPLTPSYTSGPRALMAGRSGSFRISRAGKLATWKPHPCHLHTVQYGTSRVSTCPEPPFPSCAGKSCHHTHPYICCHLATWRPHPCHHTHHFFGHMMRSSRRVSACARKDVPDLQDHVELELCCCGCYG